LVDPEEKVFVWQGVRLQLTLVNGSLPAGIGVNSLKLSLPADMAVQRAGQTPTGSEISLFSESFTLKPGERREFPPIALAGLEMTSINSRLFSILTYRPRKEVFVATLDYESLADRRPGTKTTKLLVPVKAHPLGMYAGGIIGALLAAMFLILPAVRPTTLQAAQGVPAQQAMTITERLRELGVRFARGAVVTGIAILVLQTTSDLTLPINITVHDFYGGVILGLFGDKLAAALQKWIWG
jgi:hypothetical protein